MTPIYQNKLHEVAPFLTITGHFYCPAPLLISQKTWEKISEADQKVIKELSDKYKDIERQLCADIEVEYKEKMLEEGVSIVDDIDKAAWREAAQPVYDDYEDEVGRDLIKQIHDMTSK